MRRAPASLSALGARTGLRRVLVAYLLFSIVEVATWLAVILYAFAEGGAVLTGMVAVVMVLPAAIIAPAVGGLGDGMRRGTALAGSYGIVAVATAATAVSLATTSGVLMVVLGAAFVTIAASVARPAHFAALPQLCRTPDELVSANALSSVADGLALFVGPLLAGFGVARAGAGPVFVCGAALAVLSALLCLRLGLTGSGARGGRLWREAFAHAARAGAALHYARRLFHARGEAVRCGRGCPSSMSPSPASPRGSCRSEGSRTSRRKWAKSGWLLRTARSLWSAKL